MPIDRHALVTRHNVMLTQLDGERPLQVGNGEFAFAMDITGLQSFAPFNTMSQWGWHECPLPTGIKAEDYQMQPVVMHGREVLMPMPDPAQPELSNWMRINPHRINLGRIGLALTKADGTVATQDDLKDTRQQLDLWSGLVTSIFTLEDQTVKVTTACHPTQDTLAARIESPLIKAGRLAVFLDFPGDDDSEFNNFVGNWEPTEAQEIRFTPHQQHAEFNKRYQGDTKDCYHVALSWQGKATITPLDADAGYRERFILQPTGNDSSLAFICTFSPTPLAPQTLNAETTFEASRNHWPLFWNSGGALDLSESKDERWKELERRVVLSQYLMATNEAGSLPPQESGLVNNGWFGRFHFEMIWWHATHWALWNRFSHMQGNINLYWDMFEAARELAKVQGYKGARWPKCTGPDGREWPFFNHAVMIWQQPNPIFFAELDYRAHPTKTTLEKWRPIVENTADFLASYAFYDEQKKQYVLGPPLNLVSENTDWKTTQNPTFELSYWRTGLRLAQQWRERLGQPRNAEWDKVIEGLAPLPIQDGVYVTHEDIEDMWTKWTYEHPGLIGAYGMLPGDGVDIEIMRRTLDKVCNEWNFNHVWGWDFPMLAMTAARLGEPERALDMLLHPSPNFQFDERGLATGGPFPYFPSNGGLLYAVAFMAAGWDGAPPKHAPGFPDNGQWSVRYENLSPAL